MRTLRHFAFNGDGWELALQKTWDPATLLPDAKPVVIVPGYGMNSFIFGYHPRGRSFEASLVAGGLEVWRVDLRAQGQSQRRGGTDLYGLEHFASDLGVAIDAALAHTSTRARQVSVIGCSLGGTIALSHMALDAQHRVGALVSMGGPVRWVAIHPLLRAAFASPTLVGLVPIRGTRTLARTFLPHVLRFAPSLLSMYINPEHIDVAAIDQLTQTVEDPNRYVNRQIAEWIADKDLILRGTNLSAAVRKLDVPLLCVVANGDGIVPRETAEYVYHQAGSADRTLLEVGSKAVRLAHADMFVSGHAEALVFEPVRSWLLARSGAAAPPAPSLSE